MDDVKDKITRTARKMFFDYGYRNTTIDDISNSLGMSKRTIYAHFPSKEVILDAVVNRELKKFSESVHKIVVAEKEPLEKLWELYQVSQGIVNLGLSANALKDLQNLFPEQWRRVVFTRENVLAEFGKVIDDGKKQKVFNPDIKTEVIIATLVGMLQVTMGPDFLVNSKLSLDEVFSSLFLIFTKGVCI